MIKNQPIDAAGAFIVVLEQAERRRRSLSHSYRGEDTLAEPDEDDASDVHGFTIDRVAPLAWRADDCSHEVRRNVFSKNKRFFLTMPDLCQHIIVFIGMLADIDNNKRARRILSLN